MHKVLFGSLDSFLGCLYVNYFVTALNKSIINGLHRQIHISVTAFL